MSNKTKQTHNIQFKPQNIGTIDRLVRALIGFTLLVAMLIAARTAGTFVGFSPEEFPYFWTAAIAFYPTLTAILGWDPVYQIFGIRSDTNLNGDVSGTIPEQAGALADAMHRNDSTANQH